MTSWDVLLVNAVAAFLVEPAHARGEEAERIELIRRAIPRASIDSERMGVLVGASEALVAAFQDRGSPTWSRACLEASAAVAAVLTWRALQLVSKLGREGDF